METLTVWLFMLILQGGSVKGATFDTAEECRLQLAAASLAEDVVVLSDDCYEVKLHSTGRSGKG